MRNTKGRFWTRYDKIQQAEPTDLVSNLIGSLYVVLFNANEGPHSEDLRLIHQSLVSARFPTENILVLEGNGNTRNKFVDNLATIGSLDSVVDSIRQKATPKDRLFVYMTNHGSLVNGRCNIKTYDGLIWEKEFEEIMRDLPVNFGLFYFAQCHAGGFAERMGYGRNIGMSNASRNEKSIGLWKRDIGVYFTYNLFPGILYKSIETAFDRAVFLETGILKKLSTVKPTDYDYPILSRHSIITPQLRWQNANPLKLNLGNTINYKK